MAKRTRYEISLDPAGGYTARRFTVDAEPLRCAVRLEMGTDMTKGALLALLPTLLCLVARATTSKEGEHD